MEYNLNVYVPKVPPFNHSIPFTININVPMLTTRPPIALTSVGEESGGLDMTIIIVVVVVLSIVVIIASIILGVICWRRRNKQSDSSTSKLQGK